MKTDRFADIIRRKLESIRPEFTEKDWSRMQDSLHQANLSQPGSAPTGNPFSGGAWVNKPWMIAAASVSTVALIALSVWQRREITELRQAISQLNQQKIESVAPNQSTQTGTNALHDSTTGNASKNQHAATPAEIRAGQLPRPDTVYITRYVAVPSSSRPSPVDEQPSGQRSGSPTEQRYAVTDRNSVSTGMPNQPNNLNQTQETTTYGTTSTPANADKYSANPLVTTTKPTRTKPKSATAQGDETSAATSTNSEKSPINAVAGVILVQPSSSEQQSGELSAHYELINALPLTSLSINWQSQLAQRAKRMRVARSMPVTEQLATKAPASQPVQQQPVSFRAGADGQAEAHMWSAGVYSELPISKRWVIGLGLSRATYLGGTFLTDDDFNMRTHRNFRKEFAGGMVPPQDILNIDTRIIRFQIPVNLSYRLPLNRAFTLVPAVGTYLNLSNIEKVTFYYRDMPQRGFDQANFSDNRPVKLMDTFTFSTGLEWQGGRWVLQGHPVVTIPLESCLISTPDPRWQTSTTLGFRARLMYQF